MRSFLSILPIAGLGIAAATLAGFALMPHSPLPSNMQDIVGGLACGVAAGLVVVGAVRWFKPLRDRMPSPCDAVTPAVRKRYLRELIPATIVYLVAIVVSLLLLKRVDNVWLRLPIALLPVPPIAFAIRATMRRIRDTDELQRRIELEALSFASALVSLVYFAGGLLQQAKLVDVDGGEAMLWVFPMICLSYALAKFAIQRRYA